MNASDDRAYATSRLFAAVTVAAPQPLLAVLSRLGEMGKAVRAVREDQIHVTLKFFGDVESAVIPRIVAGCEQTASRFDAFDWTLHGTGAFPSPARPSVVWVGADDGGRLAAIAEEIESFSEALGFAREGRAFHPHATLARVKFRPPPDLAELLRETADQEFGPQRATGIILYRSELGSGGSVYTAMHVAKLRA